MWFFTNLFFVIIILREKIYVLKGENMANSIMCAQTAVHHQHRLLMKDINDHGTVFGGRILAMVDLEGSLPAVRLFRSKVLTASIDHLNFIAPFTIDDAMLLTAYVTGVGRRSAEVFIKIIGEHILTGERFVGFTCFATYVTDDPQSTAPYDEVVPATDEEKAMVAGYQERRQARRTARQDNKRLLSAVELDD